MEEASFDLHALEEGRAYLQVQEIGVVESCQHSTGQDKTEVAIRLYNEIHVSPIKSLTAYSSTLTLNFLAQSSGTLTSSVPSCQIMWSALPPTPMTK